MKGVMGSNEEIEEKEINKRMWNKKSQWLSTHAKRLETKKAFK